MKKVIEYFIKKVHFYEDQVTKLISCNNLLNLIYI